MTEETAKTRAVQWVGDVLTTVEVDLRDAIRQYDEAPEREEAVWPFELARRSVDAGFLVRLVVLDAVGPTGRPLACLEVASKCAALREPVWGTAEPADLELVASAMASEVIEARRLAWKAEDLMEQAEARLGKVLGELETARALLDEQRSALADRQATIDVLRESRTMMEARTAALEPENDRLSVENASLAARLVQTELEVDSWRRRAQEVEVELRRTQEADGRVLELLRADLDAERAANARQAEGLRRADEVRGWLREALGREESASLGDLAGQACGLLRDLKPREVLTGAAALRALAKGERVLVEAEVTDTDQDDDTRPIEVEIGDRYHWISGEARVSRLSSEG